jgi:hypothetical protein
MSAVRANGVENAVRVEQVDRVLVITPRPTDPAELDQRCVGRPSRSGDCAPGDGPAPPRWSHRVDGSGLLLRHGAEGVREGRGHLRLHTLHQGWEHEAVNPGCSLVGWSALGWGGCGCRGGAFEGVLGRVWSVGLGVGGCPAWWWCGVRLPWAAAAGGQIWSRRLSTRVKALMSWVVQGQLSARRQVRCRLVVVIRPAVWNSV